MICYNIDSEVVISIDVRSSIPIPLQILNGFRDLIKREHLKPGDPVPPIRALAKKLVVSPDAVQNAYHEALSQGLFQKTKSGYCVSSGAQRIVDRVPESLLNLAKSIQTAREEGFNWETIQNVVNQLKNPKVNLPTGAICPYCRQTMEPTDSVVCCFGCNTAHHEECWNEVSRCSIFGCGSSVRMSADL
ncbi:MAG TPA: RING finger protein [Acidobacteriota bacterium]|jgi:DNA-binding transcriptional regulator YhcF (GntR family)